MSVWELYPDVSREILATSRSSVGAPEPGAFSGMMQAIGRAFPAAYNEAMSAITGVATEYGRAAAITYGATPERSVELIGSKAPIADQYRANAKALIPDPLTTGAASRFVFDATRVLTKAAVAGVTGGLPGAAIGTGALEGTLESQNLRDQGVDAITAAKAGAIRGISTGIGIGLPVAGRTLLESAGLVIAGGPVSFMAEKAAARAVLEHADYSAIAHQYDPFDPMGLALATAVPGLFAAGAHALRAGAASRGARAVPERVSTEEEVAAARTVQLAQHVDDTRLAEGHDAAGAEAHVEALNTARAQIDAGERVNVAEIVPEYPGRPYLTAAERIEKALEREAARGDDIRLDPDATFRPGTPAADMDAPAALARARQLIGDARFKELAEQAVADARGFHELVSQRKITPDEITAEIEHVARQVVEQRNRVSLQPELAARVADPDIRRELIAMRGETGWAERGGNLVRDPVTGEVSGRTAWVANAEWWPGRPDSLSARAVERAVDKAIAGDKLTAGESRTIAYMADYAEHRLRAEGYWPEVEELNAAGLHTSADQFDAGLVARAAEINEEAVERAAVAHGDNDAAFMRAIKDILDESDAIPVNRGAPGPGEEGGGQSAGARGTGGADGAGKPDAGGDAVTLAARAVVDDVPDLRVFDELTGEEVTAAELWRRAEEVYAADAREAEAYPAAVACFLSAGS